jgi:predicted nucleic acid-binding Zn ribbon protein
MAIDNNKPKILKNLLDELINSKGWTEKMEEIKLPEIWEEVVGENIAKVTKIIKLENGELLISTESSTWRSEIKLRSKVLIEKLNSRIGRNAINAIKIR